METQANQAERDAAANRDAAAEARGSVSVLQDQLDRERASREALLEELAETQAQMELVTQRSIEEITAARRERSEAQEGEEAALRKLEDVRGELRGLGARLPEIEASLEEAERGRDEAVKLLELLEAENEQLVVHQPRRQATSGEIERLAGLERAAVEGAEREQRLLSALKGLEDRIHQGQGDLISPGGSPMPAAETNPALLAALESMEGRMARLEELLLQVSSERDKARREADEARGAARAMEAAALSAKEAHGSLQSEHKGTVQDLMEALNMLP